jgi:hypothetical protein
VLDAYLNHGGADGQLGLPTTRVRHPASGGAKARFQHGQIACAGGSCTVTVG